MTDEQMRARVALRHAIILVTLAGDLLHQAHVRVEALEDARGTLRNLVGAPKIELVP